MERPTTFILWTMDLVQLAMSFGCSGAVRAKSEQEVWDGLQKTVSNFSCPTGFKCLSGM
jgi:hypothetical protein